MLAGLTSPEKILVDFCDSLRGLNRSSDDMNHFLVGIPLHFVSQMANLHVHDICLEIKLVSTEMLQYHGVGNDLSYRRIPKHGTFMLYCLEKMFHLTKRDDFLSSRTTSRMRRPIGRRPACVRQ
jgi:hypothetical protein